MVVAWLIAPTSASGPEGMPRGFESGLRYLAPAIVLGLALLPATPPLRDRIRNRLSGTAADGTISSGISTVSAHRRVVWVLAGILVLVVVGAGYAGQRRYLDHRYSDPGFTTPGLNAAFEWSRSISSARIATTGTRQYPLFGTDLSNQVDYIGIEQPHGGFTAPMSCRSWRRLLNAGDYDYVIATLDRTEAGKTAYPPSAAWTSGPSATLVLLKPPTKVFKLKGTLDPSACR
jgi:hypothetical protein